MLTTFEPIKLESVSAIFKTYKQHQNLGKNPSTLTNTLSEYSFVSFKLFSTWIRVIPCITISLHN